MVRHDVVAVHEVVGSHPSPSTTSPRSFHGIIGARLASKGSGMCWPTEEES